MYVDTYRRKIYAYATAYISVGYNCVYPIYTVMFRWKIFECIDVKMILIVKIMWIFHKQYHGCVNMLHGIIEKAHLLE